MSNRSDILRIITDHQPVTTKKIVFLTGLKLQQVYYATNSLRRDNKVKLVRNGYVIVGGEFDGLPINNTQAVKEMLQQGKYTLQEIQYKLKCSESVIFQAITELRNQGYDVRKVYWLRS